ncbi:hypothetical protein TNCV_2016461 [Trichonephila clavipes]|nr:hypothetical protein TNCV_2016461 [Trichonephila clavipes]
MLPRLTRFSNLVDSHPPPIIKTQTELVPKPDEIGNFIEDIVDFGREINLEVNSDEVQELQDSHHQELTVDELIEMHE